MSERLIIGSRASPLARVQAESFAGVLARQMPEMRIEHRFYVTSGDRFLSSALSELGGKGMFTRELDQALLDGEIDLAVHSLKDLPSDLPEGLSLAACIEREDPRDALLLREGIAASSVLDLPPQARLGGASVRRGAQALAERKDLVLVLMRGNVGTRLDKLAAGEVEAIMLAAAGLKRLGLLERAARLLPVETNIPAPGQGVVIALAAEIDAPVREALAAIDHAPTRLAAQAERAFQRRLDGSCRTPLAAHCVVEPQNILMNVEILTPDGESRWRTGKSVTGRLDMDGANALGEELAETLLRQGARLAP